MYITRPSLNFIYEVWIGMFIFGNWPALFKSSIAISVFTHWRQRPRIHRHKLFSWVMKPNPLRGSVGPASWEKSGAWKHDYDFTFFPQIYQKNDLDFHLNIGNLIREGGTMKPNCNQDRSGIKWKSQETYMPQQLWWRTSSLDSFSRTSLLWVSLLCVVLCLRKYLNQVPL